MKKVICNRLIGVFRLFHNDTDTKKKKKKKKKKKMILKHVS